MVVGTHFAGAIPAENEDHFMLPGLILILVLVAATGFFVASEFALASVRKTRILRGTDVLARAATDWAFIDLLRQRAVRIPDDVKSRFPLEPD